MSQVMKTPMLFMAILTALAVTGLAQASDTWSVESCSGARYSSMKAIGEAQTILEQNRYLAPGSYHNGELDRTTVDAIDTFQSAHSLRQTGELNFDTTALLCSHAVTPEVAVASTVVERTTYVYMPAQESTIVYKPTSKPLFVEKKPLRLQGVEFDVDQSTLRPGSLTTLDQVAASLRNWPAVNVEIQGHTSEPGTETHNMDLSQRRAEAVRAYFIAGGIDGARLMATGYGQTRFIADNSTAEGRQENRRVELHEIR